MVFDKVCACGHKKSDHPLWPESNNTYDPCNNCSCTMFHQVSGHGKGFNSRLRNLNLEVVLGINCFHANSCPQKEFCVCSPFQDAEYVRYNPKLSIIVVEGKYWIACDEDRPNAYPVSEVEKSEG